MKCKNPTCNGAFRFFHELFARFSILDTIMLDNETKNARIFVKPFRLYPSLLHYKIRDLMDRRKDLWTLSSKH